MVRFRYVLDRHGCDMWEIGSAVEETVRCSSILVSRHLSLPHQTKLREAAHDADDSMV